MNTDWSTVLLAVVTVVMVALFIYSLCMDNGGCDKSECDKCPFLRCNGKR